MCESFELSVAGGWKDVPPQTFVELHSVIWPLKATVVGFLCGEFVVRSKIEDPVLSDQQWKRLRRTTSFFVVDRRRVIRYPLMMRTHLSQRRRE